MFDKKKYMKQYRIKNRERILKQMSTWHKNNREKEEEYKRKHPEISKESSKRYREKNRELLREKRKIYRMDNTGKIKKYEKDNHEKRKGYHKKYIKTEKGKAMAQRGMARRRAKEREIINTLTSEEWLNILEKHNFRCVYCDVEFNCGLLPTKDHIVPLIKGGHNVKENIVPACQSCNSKKGISKMSCYSERCEEFIGI